MYLSQASESTSCGHFRPRPSAISSYQLVECRSLGRNHIPIGVLRARVLIKSALVPF